MLLSQRWLIHLLEGSGSFLQLKYKKIISVTYITAITVAAIHDFENLCFMFLSAILQK